MSAWHEVLLPDSLHYTRPIAVAWRIRALGRYTRALATLAKEEVSMARNLSINAYFQRMAEKHVPRYRFAGADREDWGAWQEELRPRVLQSLGIPPARVPLNPEVTAEWTEDGLVKQRFVLDVEEGLSATGYLFRPQNVTGRIPGLLACHGHGQFGKESIMGNRSSTEMRAKIAEHNYDYGLQMAKAGFAVIAIDWRGFGDRDDRRKPNHSNPFWNRDPCNVHYIRADILGMTMLGMNCSDGSRALDYLCGQDFVDPDRIGAMGLSYGGTMTLWMALYDERIRAADIICYSDRFADFGMRDTNFCGSQITPGLYALCDLADLQGLIAPRPLLVEIGSYDECFRVESAMSCFREVERIYAAAGVRDRLELDLFEGGHAWGANKSVEFFRKYL